MSAEGERPAPPEEASEPSSRSTHVVWCAVFFAVALSLQLLQPLWFDSDTAFHLAVGRLIRQQGLLQAFPWTSFSWLSDRYSDTELLFHLLLAALADLAPNTASRVAGTLLGGGLLSVLYLVLVSAGVRRPGLWVVLAIVCSGGFLVRLAMVRPHLLAVPLSLLVTWAALGRRWRWLALGAVLYPWCYLGWPLALALVLLVELARLVTERRFEWRSPALVLGGLAAGLLVHPNFPLVAEHAWVEIVDTLMRTAWGGQQALPIGGEFSSLSLGGTLRYVAPPGALALFAVATALRRRDRLEQVAFAALAALFLGLTLLSQRFLEYLVPFAAAGAALSVADARGRVAGALVAVALAYTSLVSGSLYTRMVGRTELFSAKTVDVLRRAVPEGAQVFTCDWQFTGEMMLALPERRFLVALNPIHFYRRDPELFRLWSSLVHAPPTAPARVIADRFHAGFVLCEDLPEFRPLVDALERDPGARSRGLLGPWRFFELRESHD